MIFTVTCDIHDYDEYDAFVVRAGSAEDALALVAPRFEKYQRARLTVVEVPSEGDAAVILGSFNAG